VAIRQKKSGKIKTLRSCGKRAAKVVKKEVFRALGAVLKTTEAEKNFAIAESFCNKF
jgi:hypothetical protein